MNQFIFAEREASGMTSTWDEFLCVSLNEDRTFCVYTGRREVLAEASEYYNEDTDEYEISGGDRRSGSLGHQGCCVVAEAIGNYDDDKLLLADFDQKVVQAWLVESDWVHDVSQADVKRALSKLKAAR